jgi:catechol 2,3-dioxygenase-like lactoylglutathione lyase family enzyme
MKLKNVVIAVRDPERACRFYHDLFGLQILQDMGGNVILTEGLVLQDEKIWSKTLGREILGENNACELYFEEPRLEEFREKLERIYPEVRYVTPLTEDVPGRKVLRFYDPDGHLIEVGTPPGR